MPQYQAPQIDASPSFDANRGNEAERRHWTKESYDRKNLDPVNFYDFTRKKLNFEIKRGEPLRDKDGNFRKDKKGHILYNKPSIIPCGTQLVSLKKRYDNRLEEIGHKPWENANGNQPNTNVSIVLNGDHDRMTEIAFGKPIDFVIGEDNSNVQLVTVEKEELEAMAEKYGVKDYIDTNQSYSQISIYALCFYKFLCEKFGEENVIGLECHLDETTPHFHSLVIPVAEKQKSGRTGGYTLVDDKKNPILDADGNETHITTRAYERMPEEKRVNYIPTKSTTVGVSFASYFGKTPGQTSRSYEKWHDMIHEEVTKQWGFDRGVRLRDLPPGERNDHRRKTKKQLERERLEAAKRTKEQEEKEKLAKERAEEQEKKEQDAKNRAKNADDKAAAAETKAKEQEAVVDANAKVIEQQKTAIETQNQSLAAAKRQEQEALTAAAAANAEVAEAHKEKTDLDDKIKTSTATLATVNTELEKWGAMVFDEKSIKYPSLTEMETIDGQTFRQLLESKIKALVDVLDKPIGLTESHKNWKKARQVEAQAIVTELEDALFGFDGIDTIHKQAILQLGKDLYSDAKSKIANIYKENERLKKENQELKSDNNTLRGNYNTIKNRNEVLEKDIDQERTANTLLSQELQREKMATTKDGHPITWSTGSKKGKQLTNKEYQNWLEEQFEKKKKELKDEKIAREQERQENKNEWIAHKRHMRELKGLVLAIFSGNAKKFIDIIIQHWKAELKDFARDAMNDIKSILFGAESTVDGRKTYVSDAFVWANVFAELDMNEDWKPDSSKLETLKTDAMRIADGTWEEYHKKQEIPDAVVEAVANLANTPNRKHWEDDDIDTVNEYLDTIPDDERSETVAELKQRVKAEYNIRNTDWLNDVIERLEDNTLGYGGISR